MPAGCDKLQKPTVGTWRSEAERIIGLFCGRASSGGALRGNIVKSDRGLGLAGEGSGNQLGSRERDSVRWRCPWPGMHVGFTTCVLNRS